jgi:hypothetical protein
MIKKFDIIFDKIEVILIFSFMGAVLGIIVNSSKQHSNLVTILLLFSYSVTLLMINKHYREDNRIKMFMKIDMRYIGCLFGMLTASLFGGSIL